MNFGQNIRPLNKSTAPQYGQCKQLAPIKLRRTCKQDF